MMKMERYHHKVSPKVTFYLFKNGGLTYVKCSTETKLHKMFVIPIVENKDLIMVWECLSDSNPSWYRRSYGPIYAQVSTNSEVFLVLKFRLKAKILGSKISVFYF